MKMKNENYLIIINSSNVNATNVKEVCNNCNVIIIYKSKKLSQQ